jgi:hypothetical protein
LPLAPRAGAGPLSGVLLNDGHTAAAITTPAVPF